jgi:hypothetical protein
MNDRTATILIAILFSAGSLCFLVGNMIALIRGMRS